MVIQFTTAQTPQDLEQILALQSSNLPTNISKEEAQQQGFVTVQHHYELLAAMNQPHPHIIAKANETVVGYALVMLPSFSDQIEVLKPMFQTINSLTYLEQPLHEVPYFVMGQVCVDKNFRGQQVFSGLYQKMKREMSPHFDCIITEIATRNTRSMRAHEKVGFETIHIFEDETEEWVIVAWDWGG